MTQAERERERERERKLWSAQVNNNRNVQLIEVALLFTGVSAAAAVPTISLAHLSDSLQQLFDI